jgi:pyruvate,water dikinase
VDAHLGADPGENYATILFHGGAANTSGRLHRLDFIGAVLTGRHWQVERRHDALVARIEALPDVAMAEELEHLGRLLVVTRQMDTMLGDAGAARRAAAAFQSGDTTLDVLKRDGPRE